MSDFKVRKYKPSDFERVVELANILFYPIISPFNNIEFNKGATFLKDFGLMSTDCNEGLYVVDYDSEIAGIMKLSAKEIKGEGVSISLSRVFKEYGVRKLLHTIRLFRVLNTKIPKEELYIDYLVVSDQYRSKGIGTKLLNFGFMKARELKKDKFTLNVLGNNIKAKKLYERFGFNVEKVVKFPRYVRKRLKEDVTYKMAIKL